MVPEHTPTVTRDLPDGPGPSTFREAITADIPALVRLIESAYRGDESRKGWTSEADLLGGRRTDPEGVAAVIDGRDSLMLVIERDAGIVACCQLERRANAVAYFGMFAVNPGLQAGGMGRHLLAEAERTAVTRWSSTAMHMTVIRQRAELIDWYVRRGYRRTGETSAFPYGDERFGLPTRDDLEFELLVKDLSPVL